MNASPVSLEEQQATEIIVVVLLTNLMSFWVFLSHFLVFAE